MLTIFVEMSAAEGDVLEAEALPGAQAGLPRQEALQRHHQPAHASPWSTQNHSRYTLGLSSISLGNMIEGGCKEPAQSR